MMWLELAYGNYGLLNNIREVFMKLFRILHLSDIHIGNTYMDSEDIAYRIISDIEPEIHIMDTQNLLKSKGRTMVFIEK